MDHPEDVYCSATDFKANLKHYKELAKTCVVHVTEHGRADSVLASLEVFEQRKAEAIHRAKWKVWADHACFCGTHEAFRDPELAPQAVIEYLGQPWDGHIAASFGDDVEKHDLSEKDALIMRACLNRLVVNPHAGRQIEVGPEAYLPAGIRAHQLNAGAYDIIYGLDEDDSVRVYGLIPALDAVRV